MSVAQTYHQLEEYLNRVQASGRYWFTPEEVIEGLQLKGGAFHKQLKPLVQKRKVALIRNGFYVIVTPEYQVAGAPPVTYYIDGLMKVIKRPYYIGLLNAAAWYGAAHQQPQQYSIVTLPPTLPAIQKGYARIGFVHKKEWNDLDIIEKKTNAGYVNVSSPELTALDLCHYSKHAGGINQVATVLEELVEEMNAEKLLEVAKRYINMMAIQRAGYVLELLGHKEMIFPLKTWLQEQKYHAALLDISNNDSATKVTGNDWRIIVNTEIEPDI